MIEKLRELAATWDANGDAFREAPNGSIRGEGDIFKACAAQLLALLDAEGDGWRPIETAPKGEIVLLFCPNRHFANVQRIEADYAGATHWCPLPPPPGAPR